MYNMQEPATLQSDEVSTESSEDSPGSPNHQIDVAELSNESASPEPKRRRVEAFSATDVPTPQSQRFQQLEPFSMPSTAAASIIGNRGSNAGIHDSLVSDQQRPTYINEETVKLSERIFLYPNRKLGKRGNVFEGEIRSLLLQRPCVIKQVQDTTEGDILNKLGFHGHVVSLLDSGYHKDNTVFIAIEKCLAINLHQLITNQRGSYDVTKGLQYCRQLLDGVKYIHENLIIHKDLKPTNILLTQNYTNLKIANFGKSQELNSEFSIVYCGNYGTSGYRPPESFGNSVSSLKSDIFSLGSLFYFLLSNGQSPLGRDRDLWDHNTLNGVIDLSQLLVGNPVATSHLIKLMLSLDRRHRPSMREVADHPSWNGQECGWNFDYRPQEEEEHQGISQSITVEQRVLESLRAAIQNSVDERSLSHGERTDTEGSRATPRVGTTVNSGFDISDSDEASTMDTNVILSLSVTATIYPCKRLGQQGNVFEGEIGGLVKRPCAIKITPDNKEAEILSKFSFHDHIIVLFNSGIVESAEAAAIGHTYIALEKCDEFDLHHHIVQQREHYDVSKGVDYCRQLIRGMKYVHQKLIIHKDLKPSNVLLTHNRSNVKIADFGISEEIRSSTSMVYCGNYGTRGYRPPESFGNSVASLKSDTFSLGSLFYFLLSNGKSPFGLHGDLWDHNILNGVIDLSQLQSPNPTATLHLIKLMLSLDRRHRPSMEQIDYHPSWNGQECECNFDYGFQQEYDNVASEPEEIGDNDIAATDEEIADNDKWWRRVLEHRPSAFDADSQSKANSQVDPNSEDTEGLVRDQPAEWVSITSNIRYCITPLHPGRKVYPAVQKGQRVERKLVVKIVQRNDKRDREIDNLMQLEGHRNIIRFIDYKTSERGQLFIIMERCLQNLFEYINENQFDLNKASSFFHQTSSAIAFIHSNNIVHRDLKPGNILITKDRNTIKVSNFGISKEIPDEGSVTNVSDPGPDRSRVTHSHPETGFSAPETYRGDQQTGYKADIFSLAINGYYIMTHGCHPFDETPNQRPINITANMNRDLSQIPQFPDSHPRKTAELNDLLEKMLHPTRQERPNAKEVEGHNFFKGLP